MRRPGRLVALLLALSAVALAHGATPPLQQDAAMQLLQRVAVAAQKLSYHGTFVYRSGGQSETSRIVHLSNNGNQMERLEVLDGSPREVVRHNDEVKCFLPEDRLVIVEPRSQRRSFPALLPASLAGLSELYTIRKNGQARITGYDSQIVRLEPRDAWRYGHQYWVELGSGMLLKAEIFDDSGNVLESIAFTELRIGEPASPDALKPIQGGLNQPKDYWQVRQARLRDIRDNVPWQFRVELPGFRKQAAMRRNVAQDGVETQEILHWVYSDGLSAYSVFISPQRPQSRFEEGTQTMGAISVMRRLIGGHEVVVMGDLPPSAIKLVADGIEGRRK